MDLGTRVLQQVTNLGCRVGRVQPDGDAPDRHGCDVEHDPFGPVLGVDGNPVADINSEGEQSVGGIEDGLPEFAPGGLLPDPEVLVPHHHLVGDSLRPITAVGGDGRVARRPYPVITRSDSVVMPASSDWRLERQNRSDPGNRHLLQTVCATIRCRIADRGDTGGHGSSLGLGIMISAGRRRGPSGCPGADTAFPAAPSQRSLPRRRRGERCTPIGAKVRGLAAVRRPCPFRQTRACFALPSSVFRLQRTKL